jgi:hypothetical protein
VPTLIAGGFFAVAVVALVAAIAELRTALQLTRAKAGDVSAVIDADAGTLTAPLSQRACVMFTLVLLRRRWFEKVPGGALTFNEHRRFSVVADDGRRFVVDPKTHSVAVLGLEHIEKALPFLPTAIVGLLVQRFGRKGQLWAEDYVVRAAESVLESGARVHALVEDGEVRVLSTTPLTTLGRAAAVRGAGAVVVAVVAAVLFHLFS